MSDWRSHKVPKGSSSSCKGFFPYLRSEALDKDLRKTRSTPDTKAAAVFRAIRRTPPHILDADDRMSRVRIWFTELIFSDESAWRQACYWERDHRSVMQRVQGVHTVLFPLEYLEGHDKPQICRPLVCFALCTLRTVMQQERNALVFLGMLDGADPYVAFAHRIDFYLYFERTLLHFVPSSATGAPVPVQLGPLHNALRPVDAERGNEENTVETSSYTMYVAVPAARLFYLDPAQHGQRFDVPRFPIMDLLDRDKGALRHRLTFYYEKHIMHDLKEVTSNMMACACPGQDQCQDCLTGSLYIPLQFSEALNTATFRCSWELHIWDAFRQTTRTMPERLLYRDPLLDTLCLMSPDQVERSFLFQLPNSHTPLPTFRVNGQTVLMMLDHVAQEMVDADLELSPQVFRMHPRIEYMTSKFRAWLMARPTHGDPRPHSNTLADGHVLDSRIHIVFLLLRCGALVDYLSEALHGPVLERYNGVRMWWVVERIFLLRCFALCQRYYKGAKKVRDEQEEASAWFKAHLESLDSMVLTST